MIEAVSIVPKIEPRLWRGVGERSVCREGYGVNRAGADRSENAGMSSV